MFSAELSDSKPLLLVMDRELDRKEFLRYIQEIPHRIVDTYEIQLDELCALRNPSLRDNPASLEARQRLFIREHIGNRPLHEVGVWVWYPWKNTFVHCLPPGLFEELRTGRNRDLITAAEQGLFRDCTVAIAGLSVGSHVALTLALQGGCRRMYLADADTLSGSNLNRIRVGVDALGQNKALLVARQIYEMNPYVELTIFPEGIRPENLNSFLGTPALVNIIIDEMDSLSMKLALRLAARSKNIPVLTAADNGDGIIVDVERYDLEPSLRLFGGRLKEESIDSLNKSPTSVTEIIERITQFIGAEFVEPRMIDSVQRVGTSLYSWPQLGGTANLSGIVLAYLVREIACGRAVTSGRFLFSLGQIFSRPPLPHGDQGSDVKESENIPAMEGLKSQTSSLTLDGDSLTISDVVRVARDEAKIAIDEEAQRRIQESRSAVDRWTSEGRVMYGITTGFGSMASTLIPSAYQKELQENLIRSHAANVGPTLRKEEVRAALILRLNAFAKGVSGISLEVVHLLNAMLNRGVHPLVPQFGSVGASGDLNPLAHIALAVMGEGLAEFHGKILSSRQALIQAGLSPATLRAKEGLALINGTAVMTGIGALACHDTKTLIQNAEIITALAMEALQASLEPYEEVGQKMKPHPGQLHTAVNVRNLLRGSHLVADGDHLRQLRTHLQSTLKANGGIMEIDNAVQDAYSIRAVSQVLGAVRDASGYVAERLTTEMNSANDNPLIFAARDAIFQGANFHGATVALPLDVLTIAAMQIGILSERQLNRLLSRHLNRGLPAFLARGNVGLRCGFAGAQYVATSLVAECRTIAMPASIQSIPSNEDNQDIVSMGLIAARKARDVVTKIEYILAIELLATCEALEERARAKMSPTTRAVYELVRSHVPAYAVDRPMTPDFERMKKIIHSGALVSVVEDKIGEL